MMHHVPVSISRNEARDLYRAYQKHVHYSTPIDREIMSAYQKLAAGKLVIKALESVATAGSDNLGQPKLALARADARVVHMTKRQDGSLTMTTSKSWSRRSNATSTVWFDWPAGSFPQTGWRNAEAVLPVIPLNVRPRRALQNYHILWEASWTKTPPGDPFLLRRIGKADLWLVLAMWDLTEVEKAVLSGRM